MVFLFGGYTFYRLWLNTENLKVYFIYNKLNEMHF